METDELMDALPSSVYEVSKISSSKSMMILTFISSVCPSELIIDKQKFNVRPYKARPRQCRDCFKYGHSAQRCRSSRVCAKCAQPAHGACTAKAKCFHCKGEHSADDRSCPVYKYEEEVMATAQTFHLSFDEARRRVKGPARTPATTYATVLSAPAPAPAVTSQPGTSATSRPGPAASTNPGTKSGQKTRSKRSRSGRSKKKKTRPPGGHSPRGRSGPPAGPHTSQTPVATSRMASAAGGHPPSVVDSRAVSVTGGSRPSGTG